MEQNWERTLPFININIEEAALLFQGILEKNEIDSITPIDEGCRTTNYIVKGKNQRYLLKLFFSNEYKYQTEYVLLNMLKNKGVNVQNVYKLSKSNSISSREYGIYEYAEGISLGQYLNDTGNKIDKNFIQDIAQSLAKVHSFKFERAGFFNENLEVVNKLPPLKEWYRIFLNSNVRERLGDSIVEKIIYAADKYESVLDRLDEDIRLVHGDFQGTNILVNDNKAGCIIDWEFSMAGHPIADIGQFFRYDQYYNEELIREFEIEYRKCSDYELEEDWYKVSKLRDLINLIQLMGFEHDMPNKFNDIKSLINKNLDILV